MITQYGKMEYWDNRYLRDPDSFDWYQRYDDIKDILEPYLMPDSKILNVGSGNSRLSEDLFDDGFQIITSIDISGVLIKQMNEKYNDKGPNFKYLQMDARQLEFEENSYDFIIEKATLDSLLCGENSTGNVERMLNEIYRVLKIKGTFISISHGCVEEREQFYKKVYYLSNFQNKQAKFDWDVTVKKLPRPTLNGSPIPLSPEEKELQNQHFMYICKRRNHDPEPIPEPTQEEEKSPKKIEIDPKSPGKKSVKSPLSPGKGKKK